MTHRDVVAATLLTATYTAWLWGLVWAKLVIKIKKTARIARVLTHRFRKLHQDKEVLGLFPGLPIRHKPIKD